VVERGVEVISRLKVTNFRALEAAEIPFAPLTAIVGPNGVGKTSILRAIDIVLGPAWPSMRSIRVPQDFSRFDPTRDLLIEVYFDPPATHVDAMKMGISYCGVA
jgi:predicted ATP-dependent endonuclease of OLD family